MNDNDGLIRDTLAGIANAVTEEMSAVAADPSSRYLLRFGRFIGRVGPNHLWSFECDAEWPLQPESSGQLHFEDDREPLAATVVAVGDLDLVVSVRDELGDSIASATLVAQPLFIYDALRKRLNDSTEQLLDTSMVAQLLDLVELESEDVDPTRPDPQPQSNTAEPDDEPAEDEDNSVWGLSAEQLAAAEHATRDGLRFVWGPPGTGKTSTLAASVAAMAGIGRRVMVVAHSNVAVDVAMTRVAALMADSPLLREGQVLRVGIPQLAEARDCAEILPDEIIGGRFPDLIERRRELEKERRRLSGAMRAAAPTPDSKLAHELAAVRAAQAEIDQQLTAGQNQLIRDARVVGCTLSKLVIDNLLWSWKRDAVVIDEASMAGLPFVFALAMDAPTTLACFGDFRQLPPIAVSEREGAKAWFGRDVFEIAEVVGRIEAGIPDPRLAVLRTQYRMGAVIAGAVSKVAYFDLLFTDSAAEERAHRISQVSPGAGFEVVIIDTSDIGTRCEFDGAHRSFSRFNLRAAGVTALVAHQLAQDASLEIGVISPYRAQVAALFALLRSQPRTATATMHRFQGSERDAVVIDLADAAPMKGPSRLTARDENLALRLLNVGISRARGKLVIVADLAFLRETSASTSPPLRFIDELTERGGVVLPAGELIVDGHSPSVTWCTDWWSSVDALVGPAVNPVVELSFTDPSFGTADTVERVSGLLARGMALSVRGPVEVASLLEDFDVRLRLSALGAAPMAIVEGLGVAVGGMLPCEPAVVLKGAAVTAVVQRLLHREG